MNALFRRHPTLCFSLLLCLFLGGQGAVWHHLRDQRPPMDIVSVPPGPTAVHALALGEEEAFFRLLGMEVQTAGDLFGRFTALFQYDYSLLYQWFTLLDQMDARSNYIPALASYYYAQSQMLPDVRYVVSYLHEHGQRDIVRKWWWLMQATYLAQHKLGDSDLALTIAREVEGHIELPFWVQQMPAFIHEKRGEMDDALRIMENIQANAEHIPQGELNFMKYFVKERLHTLKQQQGDTTPDMEE